ncbi:MAG TPA: peptide chain release factor N(5)-glutamine methyltransferase [Clostridiales bacterium]|nr:peptide chain release factor N(5)-glutamine methyltransferase [Clostridiales bacterium]
MKPKPRMLKAIKQGQHMLEQAGITTARLDAQLLMCHLLQRPRSEMYIGDHPDITPDQYRRYMALVRERQERKPLQYITQTQEFMGLNFRVVPGVLIPRPETEILVERVIEIYKEYYGQGFVRIADIGTGSGAIALSLAKYIDRCRVWAVDVSRIALDIARYNADVLGVGSKVEFISGHLLDALKAQDIGKWDIIVSNPPYIESDLIDSLAPEVSRYEPRQALDGGSDGLEFYRRIIGDCPDVLKGGGYLALEIGYNQGPRVIGMMNKDFEDIRCFKDLAGHDRVVTGRLKNSVQWSEDRC